MYIDFWLLDFVQNSFTISLLTLFFISFLSKSFSSHKHLQILYSQGQDLKASIYWTLDNVNLRINVLFNIYFWVFCSFICIEKKMIKFFFFFNFNIFWLIKKNMSHTKLTQPSKNRVKVIGFAIYLGWFVLIPTWSNLNPTMSHLHLKLV